MRTLLLALFLASASAAQSAKPNILLIVADDLGWNDIGYHCAEIRTPHLDALCAEGVELDCHYVQPQCTPTRVALLTGRYPSRFGAHCCQASNAAAFPVGTPTLASVLKEGGYATGMSGKWHLGSDERFGPKHHGFDHSHGSYAGAVGMYDHRYRLDSPFADTWHRNHEPLTEEGHVTDLTAAEVERWIGEHTAPDEPWFFYVPFHAVHNPLVERDPRWAELNAHIEDDERRLYASAVSHMDAAVGRMLAALERTEQRERTLIIFTSDNGAQVNHGGGAYPPPDPQLTNFSSNLPLRGKKCDVYEGGFRVPAFVNWPGALPAHKLAQPLHAIDWLPTLARFAGAAPQDAGGWDGRDVWEQLVDPQLALVPRTIYTVWGGGRQRVALRHGEYKLLRNKPGEVWELFDLEADPHEQVDLAQKRPQVVRALLDLLARERLKDAR